MGNELVLALVCVITFFSAGRLDSRGEAYDFSFLWALMSAALSTLVLVVFKAPWIVHLLSQIALFLGIGVYRFLRDPA